MADPLSYFSFQTLPWDVLSCVWDDPLHHGVYLAPLLGPSVEYTGFGIRETVFTCPHSSSFGHGWGGSKGGGSKVSEPPP